MKRAGMTLAVLWVLWVLKHLGMVAAALAFLLAGCSGSSPTGPSAVPGPGVSKADVPPVVGEWWERAQVKLSKYGVDGSGVRPEDFRWEKKTGQFSCGSVDFTSGCYEPKTKTITYQVGEEYVICHEAGHAILHVLGDARKSCFEHECMKEVGSCFAEGGE